MNKLHWCFELVNKTNRRIGIAVSYSIPLLGLLLVFEIIMRYVFNRPTTWVHDISQFLFGIGYMLGAGYTLLIDGHANMDMLYNRFGEKGRALLNTLSGVLFLFFMSILIWKCGIMAWDSLKYKEVLTQSSFEPPIYPMKIILFIGCLLLGLQGVVKLLENILVLFGMELDLKTKD